MAGGRVTAGQLRSVLAGGRVARPPAFRTDRSSMRRLPQGSAEILLAVHICLKKRSDREFALFRGELCKGRNDPSRQPRLASWNYSFGKRRERYRGFESPRSTIQSIVLRTFRRIARNRRVCARFAINAWTRRAAPAAVIGRI